MIHTGMRRPRPESGHVHVLTKVGIRTASCDFYSYRIRLAASFSNLTAASSIMG